MDSKSKNKQLVKAIKIFNNFFTDATGKWVIDDDKNTIVTQISNIGDYEGHYECLREFFDTSFSDDYFGILYLNQWRGNGTSIVARSPADYIMFDGVYKRQNEWIPRTEFLEGIISKELKGLELPSFHALKICPPGMTFYQVICLITSFSQSIVENEVQDRCFFESLTLQEDSKFQLNGIPIVQINEDL